MPTSKVVAPCRTWVLSVAILCGSLSATAMERHDAAHHEHAGDDAHAHHEQALRAPGYVRRQQDYQPPAVTLTDQDGHKVVLPAMLDGVRPVLLNFIFTSCTTVCPVLSASFAQLQQAMGPEAERVRMVSISIDPEHDTPERLRDYARRFQARAGWTFLTGEREDIVAVLKAFDSYRRDKMNHLPATFLRPAGADDWLRLDGFASANELLCEYRTAASPSAGATSCGKTETAD